MTVTPNPPLVTVTAIASVTPVPPTAQAATPTTLPTLSALEAKSAVIDLLRANDDCRLPCLLGITPGTTSIQEADTFLARFDEAIVPDEIVVKPNDFGDMAGLDLVYSEEGLDFLVSLAYYKPASAVEQVTLNGYASRETGGGSDAKSESLFGAAQYDQLLAQYTLDDLLTTYGRPSRVLLAVFNIEQDDGLTAWIPVSLVVRYDEQNFLVEYIMPRAVVGQDYVGCPAQAEIALTSWSSDPPVTLTTVLSRIGGVGINRLNTTYFAPLEQATGLTIDEFIRIFADHTQAACLRTPIADWPPIPS